jgi:hypothetical protein
MIRPFMSSDGSSTMETVVSAAWLAATRWRASATRLLLHLPHHPRHLVANELLGALQDVPLRLLDGEAGDPLELLDLLLPRGLGLLLHRLEVRFPVGEALLAALELRQLAVDLLFPGEHALLDLDDLAPLLPQLVLDFGAELERLLARFHLGLAADRLGASLRLLAQAAVVCRRRTGAAGRQQARSHVDADSQASPDPGDQEADENHHSSLLRGQARRNGFVDRWSRNQQA